MTTIQCSALDCIRNEEGICNAETIDIDNTNGIWECFDYENQEMIELMEKLKKKLKI